MRTPNYDKFPSTKFEGFILQGWNAIKECLKAASKDAVLAVDLYTGTFEEEIIAELSKDYSTVIRTSDLMKTEAEVKV